MEIKIIKNIPVKNGWILKGEICKVRNFSEFLFQLNPPYQVIDGKFSGCIIPREHCIEVTQEQTYTEKQWNDMENYYMEKLEKRLEEKMNLSKIITGLMEQINKKNAEIEKLDFCVNILAGALKASSEAVHKLRDLDKAQNG